MFFTTKKRDGAIEFGTVFEPVFFCRLRVIERNISCAICPKLAEIAIFNLHNLIKSENFFINCELTTSVHFSLLKKNVSKMAR